VILEAGIAATSLSWALVQREALKFTRVIAYDRAGLGWSDSIDTPRTPSRIARELHEMLRAAGIAPPFLLVGHSFGGLVVERFAIDFPGEVAGLVLSTRSRPASSLHSQPRSAPCSPRRPPVPPRRNPGPAGRCPGLLNPGTQREQLLPKTRRRISSGHGGQGLISRLTGEIGKLPRDTCR